MNYIRYYYNHTNLQFFYYKDCEYTRKNRILKKNSNNYYIIKFNIFQNKIIDLRNDS